MDEEHILYITSTEQQIDDAYEDLYNNPTGMRGIPQRSNRRGAP